jgi:hypothetical protein
MTQLPLAGLGRYLATHAAGNPPVPAAGAQPQTTTPSTTATPISPPPLPTTPATKPRKWLKPLITFLLGGSVFLGGYFGIRALTSRSPYSDKPYFGQAVKVQVEYTDNTGSKSYKEEERFVGYDKKGRQETITIRNSNDKDSRLEQVIESYDEDDTIGNDPREKLILFYSEDVNGKNVPKTMVISSNHIINGDGKKYDKTKGYWEKVSPIITEKLKVASQEFSSLKAIIGKEFPKRFETPKSIGFIREKKSILPGIF